MFALVVYDISHNKLRDQIHTICRRYGVKVQRSVFEIDVHESRQIDDLIEDLQKTLDSWKKRNDNALFAKEGYEPSTETIRVYRMNERQRQKVVVMGDGMPVTETPMYEIL